MSETRYIARETKELYSGQESKLYPYMVWDTQDNKCCGLVTLMEIAENYAAQMNEKGFIEP